MITPEHRAIIYFTVENTPLISSTHLGETFVHFPAEFAFQAPGGPGLGAQNQNHHLLGSNSLAPGYLLEHRMPGAIQPSIEKMVYLVQSSR